MMSHPPVTIIIVPGGPGPSLGKVFDQAEQRLMAFRKIADLRRPVVHFDVDIGGILAAPGRQNGLVPDALEVGCLSAGSAAGDQEIPAELEAECFEIGI